MPDSIILIAFFKNKTYLYWNGVVVFGLLRMSIQSIDFHININLP